MVMVFTGTDEFVTALQRRSFRSASEILMPVKSGADVTVENLARSGFTQPIFITKKDGLKLRVPGIDFTVRDVAILVGPDREVDVIDVRQQEGVTMTIRDFVEHFYAPKRDVIYNIISLEFSRTPLSNHVTPPDAVRKLSLVRRHWIRPDDSDGEDLSRPHVQKYCLISMADSFTDFHIDFGGSSVWYHILWGEKVFYLIEPTPENLKTYKRWMKSEHNRSTFLPSLLDEDCCYEIRIRTGNTLFIPSGWIHAVFTPEDSLVFGGNFLHEINIPMQLRVYAVEKSLSTMDKFLFPYFEELHWFVAFNLIRQVKQDRTMKAPPRYLVKGLAALSTHLKRWYELKVSGNARVEDDDDLPHWFDRNKVLSDLLKLVPTLGIADDSSERSWTSSERLGEVRKRRLKAVGRQRPEDGSMTAQVCGGVRIRITKKGKRKLETTTDLPSIKEELRLINEDRMKKESSPLKREVKEEEEEEKKRQEEREETDDETRQLFASAKESGDFLYYDSAIDPLDKPKRKKKARTKPKVEMKEDADFDVRTELSKERGFPQSTGPSTSQGNPTSPNSSLQGRFGRRKGEATVKQRLGKKLGLSKMFR